MAPHPRILAIIAALIEREGDFSNHPSDKGGPTRWGITEAVAREEGYLGAMATLPQSFAVSVYMRRYVSGPGFDKVLALSPRIAEELVDTGVNMGERLPGPWLQRILNGLNRQGKDYPDLKVDGQVGPGTLAALRALLAKRGAAGERAVLRALNCLQGARYIEITEARPANEDFLFGWLDNRVEIV